MSERFRFVLEWCYFAGIALAALLNTLERGWLQSGIGWGTAAVLWLFAIDRGRRMRRAEATIDRVEDVCEVVAEHYVRGVGSQGVHDQYLFAKRVRLALNGESDE